MSATLVAAPVGPASTRCNQPTAVASSGATPQTAAVQMAANVPIKSIAALQAQLNSCKNKAIATIIGNVLLIIASAILICCVGMGFISPWFLSLLLVWIPVMWGNVSLDFGTTYHRLSDAIASAQRKQTLHHSLQEIGVGFDPLSAHEERLKHRQQLDESLKGHKDTLTQEKYPFHWPR